MGGSGLLTATFAYAFLQYLLPYQQRSSKQAVLEQRIKPAEKNALKQKDVIASFLLV